MGWKKITIVGVCFLCFVLFLVAYEKPWLWSLERRLRSTRLDIASQIRQHQNPDERYASSLTEQLRRANILAGLCVETPLDLEDPTICDASFFHIGTKGVMIVVYWLQDQPTPETLRLVWEDGRIRDCPILAEQTEANLKIARRAVLYDAAVVFPNGSAEETELDAQSAASVVLVKAGEEISARWPLALVDRIPAGENEE